MKKLVCFLLSLVLLAAAMPVLATDTASGSFPIVTEPITIRAMGLQSPQGGDHNDMIAWQKYEEMTGIHIEWENVPTDGRAERLSVVMASNDLPDMFWAMEIKTNELVRYGSMGVFMQLDEYFDKFAPNLQAVIAEHPAIGKGIRMADGHIYGMPNLTLGENMQTNKMFINPNWLEKVGKSTPTNFAEFEDVLRAFKAEDANDNGDPNDEIPLITRYHEAHFLPSLYTYFGLGNRGTAHRFVDWDEEKGALRFIPTSPEFKDLLTWVNMLYTDGLLDKETFENTSSRQIVAKASENLVGVHSDYVTNTGSAMQDVFRCLPVMENKYGNKEYTRNSNMIASPGAFVLSSKCQYPEEMMKWVDFFYGDEGQLYSNMGVEGVTYERDADGKVHFTDEMIKNPEGLTLTQVRVKYMGFQGGAVIYSDEYYQGAETYWTSTELMDEYRPYLNKEVWEPFNPTYEEGEAMSDIWVDMLTYINEMTAAFITGSKPMSDWDSYVAEFDKMGLAQYMELYNAQYERYQAN